MKRRVCPECHGHGTVTKRRMSMICGGFFAIPTYHSDTETCDRCHGQGTITYECYSYNQEKYCSPSIGMTAISFSLGKLPSDFKCSQYVSNTEEEESNWAISYEI